MTPDDFNTQIIKEFRASSGQVGGQFAGAPLLLLHSVGARSGRGYVSPMMYLPGPDRYFVFASNGGADSHPAWYHNLLAHPETSIEIGPEEVRVRAVEVRGEERDSIYARQAELYPGFAEYQAGTARTIPVVALVPESGT